MATTYIFALGVDRTEGNYTTPLDCCEYDAESVCKTFRQYYNIKNAEYNASSACTTDFFYFKMEQYARKLKKGDTLVLYFSGHGGQVLDLNRDEFRANKFDETICLYDRMLLDDEIHNCFCKFKKGVNLIFFSDSCHSGTVNRGVAASRSTPPNAKYFKEAERFQTMHKDIYQNIKILPSSARKANLFFMGACQDDQYSYTGNPNSVFTASLLRAIKSSPESNLNSIAKSIQKDPLVLRKQTPTVRTNEIAKIPLTSLLQSENEKPKFNSFGIHIYNIEMKSKEAKSKLLKQGSKWFDTEVKILSEGIKSVSLDFGKETDKDRAAVDKKLKSIKRTLNTKKMDYAYVEPDFEIKEPADHVKSVREANPNEFLKSWPHPTSNIFDWYKKDNYTQLESALQHVKETVDEPLRNVRIAHIDTGCWPEHPASPVNLNTNLGNSFVKGETKDPKVRIKNGKANFHGLATGILLAGGNVTRQQGRYDQTSGEVGAIPFAEIIPIRIADDVVLVLGKLEAFAQAVEYAIQLDCDVISISMGGAPSRKMAEVINKAYEKGIVVVAAAGNNFNVPGDILVPEEVVYPSRFDRVITAVGATANFFPYDFDAQDDVKNFVNGEQMQGNSNPPEVMRYAVAAFTPNVPWAYVNINEQPYSYSFSRRGGGTSSATPQIAAAAALYIVKFRNELISNNYAGTWRQAESVRRALFQSADGKRIPQSKRYYGNGILQARTALENFVKVKDEHKAAPAKVHDLLILNFIEMYSSLI
ncbi:MAG TPA: S8 family serine peptidase [Saprospiraceae bacterium]|nr:S8 family serine peptidase [Saprospiraceae bacterium]